LLITNMMLIYDHCLMESNYRLPSTNYRSIGARTREPHSVQEPS